VKIGEEISSPSLGSYSNGYLALAHLNSGDLHAARVAVEAARGYDEPPNNHYVLALLGVITLGQGDQSTAHEAFTAAIAQADGLLTHTAQNYSALDTKGLALCGLTLCEKSDHVTAAVEAYRAARAINKDAGIIGRVLRLLDTLALADPARVPARVRAAAAGE